MSFTLTQHDDGWHISRDGRYLGRTVPASPNDGIAASDVLCPVKEGVYRWTRTFTFGPTVSADLRLTMDWEAPWMASYAMIPAVSYDGNRWGKGLEPKGFERDGEPWSFAWHRTAVAGATYSEGAQDAVCLFAPGGRDTLPFSCALIRGSDQTIHRLIWPEEERPLTYSMRDRYSAPYQGALAVTPGQTLTLTAYVVLTAATPARQSWRKTLDFAWGLHREQPPTWMNASQLWEVGIAFAKDSLWAEDGPFRGFSVGLRYGERGWEQVARYEIGWCGQNASLAVSLLVDYLRTGAQSSLDKGLATLDCWVAGAVLPNGLMRVHYDHILEGRTDDVQDAVNLAAAANFLFEAADIAARCGIERVAYRQVALGICDFARRAQGSDGRFGLAWSNDGTCVDPHSTAGCALIPPLVQAHALTGDATYLKAATRAYWSYLADLRRDGYTSAGALDTYCIDKESAIPLVSGGLALYHVTGDPALLAAAEDAAYYLATWQWHHTVRYPQGTALHSLGYDTFGGTAVSTQHHHQDPFALSFVPHWLELAHLTGHDIWRERALAAWANGTAGISDGALLVQDKPRPVGSQSEGAMHTRWGHSFGVSDWLVAWPTAFRLEVLRKAKDWAVFDSGLC